MIQLVVGWIKNFFKVEEFTPVETVTPSRMGYYLMREVLELRNYLAKYTRSNKEAYQNGYLYIMAV